MGCSEMAHEIVYKIYILWKKIAYLGISHFSSLLFDNIKYGSYRNLDI